MSESPAQVLIVDDDRFIQRFLADQLGRLGFQVAVERDGEWALETFAQRSFDAVILDLHLPGISGYDVARKIRSSPRGKSTPIVMISGVYRNALHRQEALEKHGASAFLEKPISLPALEQALRAAVGDRYPSPPETLLPARGPGERAEPLADAAARDEASQVEQAARTVAAFPSLRGSLENKPFPELLAEIHRWRATGALLLRREKVKKIVYFQGGAPQYVKSNLLSECLGRLLVKERMISEAQCEESLRRMKASGRQQGTVLIEQGALSPQNLVYALTLQLREKLFEVFAWESGDFQFSPKVARPGETIGLELSPAAIIYEGVRRTYDAPRLGRALGDVDHAFPAPVDDALYALQRLDLGDEERTLLAAIDGRRSVATLRALGLLSDLETDRLIYALKCAGMISFDPAARTSAPKISFAEPIPIELEDSAQVLAFPKRTATPRPGSFEPVRTSLDEGGLLPELSWPHGQSSDAALERERLAAKVAALRKMDYFQILGVPTNAPKDAIEKAFLALAREHHPDRHRPFASAETQQLVEQIYQLLQAAHDTLVDASERARYAERMSEVRQADFGDDVGRILAAEARFQRGEELLRQKKPREALECFQEAVRLYDQEGEFHAYLGWSQFLAHPDDPTATSAALRALGRAIALNPKADRGYLFTAHVYKAIGQPKDAERHYEKAIQCNPGCTEALRELSILGYAERMRARK